MLQIAQIQMAASESSVEFAGNGNQHLLMGGTRKWCMYRRGRIRKESGPRQPPTEELHSQEGGWLTQQQQEADDRNIEAIYNADWGVLWPGIE